MADNKKTIQGKELTEKKPGQFKMANSDYKEVMSDLGVTKEVRDTVEKAEETVENDALKVAQESLKENKGQVERATVQMGDGHNSIEVDVTGHKEGKGRDPQTGEPIDWEKYGSVRVQQKKQVPKSLRNDIVPEIEKDCEKIFGKK